MPPDGKEKVGWCVIGSSKLRVKQGTHLVRIEGLGVLVGLTHPWKKESRSSLFKTEMPVALGSAKRDMNKIINSLASCKIQVYYQRSNM